MTVSRIALATLLAGCTNSPSGGAGGSASASGNTLDLHDVKTFWLPINSERFGVSGKSGDVCVGLVWDFSSLGMARTEHCDDFGEGFPYSVIHAANGQPCAEVWDYRRNAVVQSASGCIEPSFDAVPGHHTVDVTVELSSALFAGELHVVAP